MSQPPKKSEWIIGPEEMEALPKSTVLVDVREPEEFEHVHLEGAKLIPLGELSQRAASELSTESEIVVYCAHGIRSMEALFGLKMLGFKKVRSLEGGLAALGFNV